MDSMMNFLEQIRDVSGKPVGLKMVIGSEETFEEFVAYMDRTKRSLISLPLTEEREEQGQPIKPWRILSGFQLNQP